MSPQPKIQWQNNTFCPFCCKKAKVKKKRPIIFNGYRSAFGWHVNSEEGRFKPDERGSWLSSLLLCVGSGFGRKKRKEKQILFLEESAETWDGQVRRGMQNQSAVMGKVVRHWNTIKLFQFVLCSHDYHTLCRFWSSNQHSIDCLVVFFVCFFLLVFLLQQPTCLPFEGRLIACISWLARNPRSACGRAWVCEMTCVWADVVRSVPDIPTPLRYLQLNRSH